MHRAIALRLLASVEATSTPVNTFRTNDCKPVGGADDVGGDLLLLPEAAAVDHGRLAACDDGGHVTELTVLGYDGLHGFRHLLATIGALMLTARSPTLSTGR